VFLIWDLSEAHGRYLSLRSLEGDIERFVMLTANQSAASNRRPAGQAGGSDNFFATVAADRAFPAAVADR